MFFLACFLLSSCQKAQDNSKAGPDLEISVTQVTSRDVPITMEFVGQTKGSVDAEIRARVEGVLQGMHFEEGKDVEEGQLLYTIDPAPFQAKVAEVNGKLAEAETRLAKAESDLKRVRPLVEMKALSERDLDAAVAQEGAARGALNAAKAVVESAEIELGYTKITSPTKGIIGLSKAKIGEFVGRAPNPVVLNTVSNLDPIHARFSLTEKEYLRLARQKQAKLDTGQTHTPVELELILGDGSVHPERGKVASADREIDPKTGTLTVEATFPNPHKLVRPGQFAKVKGVTETINSALIVPKRAVQELQGQHQVFVIKDDNTVETRTVELGPVVQDSQVIEKGLAAGEKVALDGLQRLKTGMHISAKLEGVKG